VSTMASDETILRIQLEETGSTDTVEPGHRIAKFEEPGKGQLVSAEPQRTEVQRYEFPLVTPADLPDRDDDIIEGEYTVKSTPEPLTPPPRSRLTTEALIQDDLTDTDVDVDVDNDNPQTVASIDLSELTSLAEDLVGSNDEIVDRLDEVVSGLATLTKTVDSASSSGKERAEETATGNTDDAGVIVPEVVPEGLFDQFKAAFSNLFKGLGPKLGKQGLQSIGPSVGAAVGASTGSGVAGAAAGTGAGLAASALAGLGPAGLAIGGVTLAASGTAKALLEVTERLEDFGSSLADSIEPFSPDVAHAKAVGRSQEIAMLLARTETLGKSLGEMTRLQHDIRDSMERLNTAMGEVTVPILNEILRTVDNYANGAEVVANAGVDLMEKYFGDSSRAAAFLLGQTMPEVLKYLRIISKIGNVLGMLNGGDGTGWGNPSLKGSFLDPSLRGVTPAPYPRVNTPTG